MVAGSRLGRALVAGGVGLGLLLAPTASIAKPGGGPRYVAGASGAGDPYFPYSGNGGYDVRHYELDLTYTPPAARAGAADRTARRAWRRSRLRPTQDLDRFNLDLRGLDVTPASPSTASRPRRSLAGRPVPQVRVPPTGRSRRTQQRKWELVVQPRPKLKKGKTVEVVVEYGGATTRPVDIEGVLVRLGHHARRRDGRQRARRRDDLVPRQRPPHRQGDVRLRDHGPGGQGGRGQRAAAARADHRRRLDDLVLGRPRPAGELPVDRIGRRLRPPGVRDGRRSADHRRGRRRRCRPTSLATTNASLALEPEIIGFLEMFGPYPFNSAGAIVDDDSVGYALETQTRPIYSRCRRQEHGRPRAGPPVVRQRGEPVPLGRHLAQRGLGDLRRVDVVRGPGPAPPRRSSSTTIMAIPADDEFWAHRGRRPRAVRAVPEPESTTAARRRSTRSGRRSATRPSWPAPGNGWRRTTTGRRAPRTSRPV